MKNGKVKIPFKYNLIFFLLSFKVIKENTTQVIYEKTIANTLL